MWPKLTLEGWVLVPAIGFVLVVIGYLSLTLWFRRLARPEENHTDVHVVRIAYWLIGFGLSMLGLWAVSALAIRFLALIKFYEVLH